MGEPGGIPLSVLAVVEALSDAVVVTDPADVVLFWNGSAERLFGYPASEVVGQRLPTLPGPEEAGLREEWLREVRRGALVETTARRRRRDGALIDVNVRYTPINDGDEFLGVVGVCRPLVESVAAENSGRESFVRLTLVRHLAELTSRIGMGADVDGVLRAVAEVAVSISGADSGAVSLRGGGGFRRVARVGLGDDIPDEVVSGHGLHGQVVATGREVVVEDYAAWEHGLPELPDLRATVAVPIRIAGEIAGALSVHHRTSSSRFAQPELEALRLLADFAAAALATTESYQRLLREQRRASALLDAVPDALVVVEDGLVTEWNACATRLTGKRRDDVIGRPLPAEIQETMTDVVDTGGSTHRLEPVMATLDDGATRVILLRDVTEQYELDRAKDLFFATTSHELKTPLTVIKGFAATLRQRWDEISPEHRDEALATVHRRAEHLEQLIERILVGSRVGAGGNEVRIGPVDVGPLVTAMVEAFAAVSDQHQLTAELQPGLPVAAADRQAVDTILGHLIENAVKYSPEGGPVTVRASGANGKVEIEVLDEGVGLPERVEELFRPFVQADTGDSRQFGGVGLGLYIVRRLVMAQNGELVASRRAGRGSRFAFTLPVWRSVAP